MGTANEAASATKALAVDEPADVCFHCGGNFGRRPNGNPHPRNYVDKAGITHRACNACVKYAKRHGGDLSQRRCHICLRTDVKRYTNARGPQLTCVECNRRKHYLCNSCSQPIGDGKGSSKVTPCGGPNYSALCRLCRNKQKSSEGYNNMGGVCSGSGHTSGSEESSECASTAALKVCCTHPDGIQKGEGRRTSEDERDNESSFKKRKEEGTIETPVQSPGVCVGGDGKGCDHVNIGEAESQMPSPVAEVSSIESRDRALKRDRRGEGSLTGTDLSENERPASERAVKRNKGAREVDSSKHLSQTQHKEPSCWWCSGPFATKPNGNLHMRNYTDSGGILRRVCNACFKHARRYGGDLSGRKCSVCCRAQVTRYTNARGATLTCVDCAAKKKQGSVVAPKDKKLVCSVCKISEPTALSEKNGKEPVCFKCVDNNVASWLLALGNR